MSQSRVSGATRTRSGAAPPSAERPEPVQPGHPGPRHLLRRQGERRAVRDERLGLGGRRGQEQVDPCPGAAAATRRRPRRRHRAAPAGDAAASRGPRSPAPGPRPARGRTRAPSSRSRRAAPSRSSPSRRAGRRGSPTAAPSPGSHARRRATGCRPSPRAATRAGSPRCRPPPRSGPRAATHPRSGGRAGAHVARHEAAPHARTDARGRCGRHRRGRLGGGAGPQPPAAAGDADLRAVQGDLEAARRQPGDPLLHQQPVVVDEPASLGEGRRPLRAVHGEPLGGRRAGVAVRDLLEAADGVGGGDLDRVRVPRLGAVAVHEQVAIRGRERLAPMRGDHGWVEATRDLTRSARGTGAARSGGKRTREISLSFSLQVERDFVEEEVLQPWRDAPPRLRARPPDEVEVAALQHGGVSPRGQRTTCCIVDEPATRIR